MQHFLTEATAIFQILKQFWFISCPMGIFLLFKIFGKGQATQFGTAEHSKIARAKLFAEAQKDELEVTDFKTEEDGGFTIWGIFKKSTQKGTYASVDEKEFKEIDEQAKKDKGWWG